MNHSWRAGIKVHFLSGWTISQEIRPSPPISICMEATSLSPEVRRGIEGSASI